MVTGDHLAGVVGQQAQDAVGVSRGAWQNTKFGYISLRPNGAQSYMFKPLEYLSFAEAADHSAKTASTLELRAHFVFMAGAWRDLVAYTAATEACRPGGPCLD
ncbi:hypothetical protein M9M90_21065 (plasmid) [Phenylobacterium sp. LH3H17]|uniref:hypothetical protein n=1 Tax=Phenylobacterium sp. LH3H17 TaxID=2903901 RepID=UPI0020C9BECB|nr:hypothetical protein [Phenylobacterium sp. LH3H17]UTP41718.1 hypothetical protein M9M90_21065 [Phenylobacterium sp. LH3H17]